MCICVYPADDNYDKVTHLPNYVVVLVLSRWTGLNQWTISTRPEHRNEECLRKIQPGSASGGYEYLQGIS